MNRLVPASLMAGLALLALAFALGVGMVDDSSALRQLLNALVLSYQKISFAISLP